MSVASVILTNKFVSNFTLVVLLLMFLPEQVAECYCPLKELVEGDGMKGYLPECWISCIKVRPPPYHLARS